MSGVSRRQFVGGAAVAGVGLLAGCGRLPFPDRPQQQPERLVRIGVLSVNSRERTIGTEALVRGLANYGYVEGRNLIIEWRSADGTVERLPALADELVGLQPEVIVVPSAIDALIAS